MGKRGRPTAQGIRDFVIQAKRNAPALSPSRIADRVEANFGEEARIDKTTVRRILARAGLGAGAAGAAPAQQGLDRQAAAAHWGMLLPTLLDLLGVGPFPFHDYDLAIWHSRADEPCWPIAKGRVCRDSNGQLTVSLDVEGRLEWSYLRQHLPNDAVWAAIRDWQEAMAADVSGRLALLQDVKDGIQRPAAAGGLGLPVCAEMGRGGTGQPAVSFYYAFRLFDQVLSHALRLRHAPYTSGAFTLDSPNTLHLGGYPVVSSPDPAQRQAAVDFLLINQSLWASLPSAQAAEEAFRRAEAATGAVKQHLERLRLALAFPSGSVCDSCRDWAVG
jgi:hypothetical protein